MGGQLWGRSGLPRVGFESVRTGRVLADMAATGARIEVVSGKAAGTVLIVEPELMLGRQADSPGDPAGRARPACGLMTVLSRSGSCLTRGSGASLPLRRPRKETPHEWD